LSDLLPQKEIFHFGSVVDPVVVNSVSVGINFHETPFSKDHTSENINAIMDAICQQYYDGVDGCSDTEVSEFRHLEFMPFRCTDDEEA